MSNAADDLLEINDFSQQTDFEKSAAAIETVVRQWMRGDRDELEAEVAVKGCAMRLSYAGAEGPEEAGEPPEPSFALMQGLGNAKLDFATDGLPPLHQYFGVTRFILLEPSDPSASFDADTAASVLTLAAASAGARIPAFLCLPKPKHRMDTHPGYQGYAMTNNCIVRFQSQVLPTVPEHCKTLGEVLDLFYLNLGLRTTFEGDGMAVSTRFSYRKPCYTNAEWARLVSIMNKSGASGFEEPWGSFVDPVESITARLLWPATGEAGMIDNSVWSVFDVKDPPTVKLATTWRGTSGRLTELARQACDIGLDALVFSREGVGGNGTTFREARRFLSKKRRKPGWLVQQGIVDILAGPVLDPDKDSHSYRDTLRMCESAIEAAWGEGDDNASSSQDSRGHTGGASDKDEPPARTDRKAGLWERVAVKGFRGASTLRELHALWHVFLAKLEACVERREPIPTCDVPESETVRWSWIDKQVYTLGTCLALGGASAPQQNEGSDSFGSACGTPLAEDADASPGNPQADGWAGADDDENFHLDDPSVKRAGVSHVLKGSRLAGDSTCPVYVPRAQSVPAPLLPFAVEARTAAEPSFEEKTVLSDMRAFKAANPQSCVGFVDFLQWYSPRDVETAEDGGKLTASARMQMPDNMWIQLWNAAVACPAGQQDPLFDVSAHILATLGDLRNCDIAEVVITAANGFVVACFDEMRAASNVRRLPFLKEEFADYHRSLPSALPDASKAVAQVTSVYADVLEGLDHLEIMLSASMSFIDKVMLTVTESRAAAAVLDLTERVVLAHVHRTGDTLLSPFEWSVVRLLVLPFGECDGTLANVREPDQREFIIRYEFRLCTALSENTYL
ncbi:Rab3 GTPase-activating protein catalytic subunit [Diplonema papillatum]|nr:Rab3 GTPase-activating protein catalytic subunit [Diplonema papillatum]